MSGTADVPVVTAGRTKDGIPTRAGEANTFIQYEEAALLWEQSLTYEKRYTAGPKLVQELTGAARRLVSGLANDSKELTFAHVASQMAAPSYKGFAVTKPRHPANLVEECYEQILVKRNLTLIETLVPKTQDLKGTLSPNLVNKGERFRCYKCRYVCLLQQLAVTPVSKNHASKRPSRKD